MVKKKRGLGRGLSALIPDEPKEDIKKNDTKETVENISLSDIKPNKNQPRKEFNDEDIKELSISIDKVGLIQPIIVGKTKTGYEIIAGERRFRAVKMLGLEKIPAIIRDKDEKKSAEMALIENIQREDLNIIEEAYAYENILKNNGITQEELAGVLGKSRSYITNIMRLLKLTDEVKNMIREGILTSGHGRTLLSLEKKERQYEIAQIIIEKKLSVREAEKLISELNKSKKKKEKAKRPKDPLTVEIEENLRKLLGTKVSISKGTKKGKIEIEYYNEDDLDRILDLLNS